MVDCSTSLLIGFVFVFPLAVQVIFRTFDVPPRRSRYKLTVTVCYTKPSKMSILFSPRAENDDVYFASSSWLSPGSYKILDALTLTRMTTGKLH